MAQVRMSVNGASVSGEVERRTLLSTFLRDTQGLTGTHVGCDTGQGRACTIRVNGASVKSCNMLALEARGAEVSTIEAMANADGDPAGVSGLSRAAMRLLHAGHGHDRRHAA